METVQQAILFDSTVVTKIRSSDNILKQLLVRCGVVVYTETFSSSYSIQIYNPRLKDGSMFMIIFLVQEVVAVVV